MKRNRTTNTSQIVEDLIKSLTVVRSNLDLTDEAICDAMAEVETFCVIASRIMAKTNPSKVRSVAVTVEIGARLTTPPNF